MALGPVELIVLLATWLIPLTLVIGLLILVIRMVRAQEETARALREMADHLAREGGAR